MSSVLGFLAATLSSLLMTIGFIIFDKSWKGSAFHLNLFKCSLATYLFLIVAYITTNGLKNNTFNILMLFFSSLIGIVVGDITWLISLKMIGARRVIVVDAIKPLLGTLLGYFFLDERISLIAVIGILLTIIGVLMVSLEKSQENASIEKEKESNGNLSIELGGESFKSEQHDDLNQSTNPLFNKENIIDFSSSSSSSSHSNLDHSSPSPSSGDSRSRHSDADPKNSNSTDENLNSKKLFDGYLLATVNVLFDSIGALITKIFGAGMSTWEINLIRFGFAQFCLSLIIICVYVYFNRKMERSSGHFLTLKKEETFELDISNNILENNNNISLETSDPSIGYHVNSNLIYSQIMVYPDMKPRDWLQVTLGILFLTFATPALSNYSLLNIDMGACLTLTSLGPIFSLPLVYIMKNEQISLRACIGAFVSVIGIAVMYIS